MSKTTSSYSGGIGFAGLLTIVFITLKLCNVINWPWVWVLSPVWIPLAIVVSIVAICACGWLLKSILQSK